MQGTVGTFSKDKFKGKFVDEWNAFLKESNVELDTRDVGAPLAGPLAVKDEEEIVSGCFTLVCMWQIFITVSSPYFRRNNDPRPRCQ